MLPFLDRRGNHRKKLCHQVAAVCGFLPADSSTIISSPGELWSTLARSNHASRLDPIVEASFVSKVGVAYIRNEFITPVLNSRLLCFGFLILIDIVAKGKLTFVPHSQSDP